MTSADLRFEQGIALPLLVNRRRHRLAALRSFYIRVFACVITCSRLSGAFPLALINSGRRGLGRLQRWWDFMKFC